MAEVQIRPEQPQPVLDTGEDTSQLTPDELKQYQQWAQTTAGQKATPEQRQAKIRLLISTRTGTEQKGKEEKPPSRKDELLAHVNAQYGKEDSAYLDEYKKRLVAAFANAPDEQQEEIYRWLVTQGIGDMWNASVAKVEADRTKDRESEFNETYDAMMKAPIEAAMLNAGPRGKAYLDEILQRVKDGKGAMLARYQQWYNDTLNAGGDRTRLDAIGVAGYFLQDGQAFGNIISPDGYYGGAFSTAQDFRSGMERAAALAYAQAERRAANVEELDKALQSYIDALERSGNQDALGPMLDALKRIKGSANQGMSDFAKQYREVADAVTPQMYLDTYLPQMLANEMAGSPDAAGIVAGNAAATVSGIAALETQRKAEAEQVEKERKAVAQQQADIAAIKQAHQQNPNFDLNTALANYDAAVKTGQKPDAQAILTQAQSDFAAQPQQVTAKNTGEVIELWRKTQDFDLMAVLGQIGADPKADVAAIVTKARADWQTGISQTQAAAVTGLAGLTQTFGEGEEQVSFRPGDAFGPQGLANIGALFRVAQPGSTTLKEPVGATKVREALAGATNVPGADPFSAAEIGQLSGQQSRVTQLMTSVASMKGIDLSKPFTDTRALADFNAALAMSMRQAQQADANRAREEAQVNAKNQAEFEAKGQQAEVERQKKLSARKPRGTRVF